VHDALHGTSLLDGGVLQREAVGNALSGKLSWSEGSNWFGFSLLLVKNHDVPLIANTNTKTNNINIANRTSENGKNY